MSKHIRLFLILTKIFSVEIGRRIYYDDEFQLLREVIEKNKNKSETTRAFSAYLSFFLILLLFSLLFAFLTVPRALTNKRRYLPDLLASFPMKKCFDMSLEGLPATIYQFAFTGIVGAAYCGLRWKAKLPSLVCASDDVIVVRVRVSFECYVHELMLCVWMSTHPLCLLSLLPSNIVQ